LRKRRWNPLVGELAGREPILVDVATAAVVFDGNRAAFADAVGLVGVTLRDAHFAPAADQIAEKRNHRKEPSKLRVHSHETAMDASDAPKPEGRSRSR
jgi:hypothetical protein